MVTDPGSIAALAVPRRSDAEGPCPSLSDAGMERTAYLKAWSRCRSLPEWAAVRLAAVEGLDFEIGLIPQGPEGRVTFFIPGGAGIFSNTDAPDAAWEVLKLVYEL